MTVDPEIVRLARIVLPVGDDAVQWLSRPNSAFDDQTPSAVAASGREGWLAVKRHLMAWVSGGPASAPQATVDLVSPMTDDDIEFT
jgi:hypothetical protein